MIMLTVGTRVRVLFSNIVGIVVGTVRVFGKLYYRIKVSVPVEAEGTETPVHSDFVDVE